MILESSVNAADLTARAYVRRTPRYPVIPETLGLALVLLANRNTTHDRAIWLTQLEVSSALCRAAEAFAETLTGNPSPAGWRAGALASLRTLVPGALHEVTEPWPWARENERPDPVARFWLDDNDEWYWASAWRSVEQPPIRTELARRLTVEPNGPAAWEAMRAVMNEDYDRYRNRAHWRGTMASWSNLHERGVATRDLYAELIEGRDLAAERDARWEKERAQWA